MRRSTILIALAILAVLPATAGAKLTRLPGTGETPGVAIAPDGTVVLGSGSEFVRTSLTGPFEPRFVELNRGYGSFETVGFAGGRPVYVSGGRAPTTAVRRWTGRGDIFDAATWTRLRHGPAMVYYDLDEGPRGLWLVHERRRGIDDTVVVRRWRKGRFGPARAIPGSAGNVLDTAIAQDARGRFAVAWFDSRGNRVRVAASRTGRRWSRARTVGRISGLSSTLAIGLGGGGRGLVAIDQSVTSKPVLVRRFSLKGLLR